MAEVFTSLQCVKLLSTFCTEHVLGPRTPSGACVVGTGVRLPLPTGTFPGSLKMHGRCPNAHPRPGQGRGWALAAGLALPSSLLPQPRCLLLTLPSAGAREERDPSQHVSGGDTMARSLGGEAASHDETRVPGNAMCLSQPVSNSCG